MKLAGSDRAVSLENLVVSKVDIYQQYLDLVQTKESSDRVTFQPLGTPGDRFSHTVLNVVDESGQSTVISCQAEDVSQALARHITDVLTIFGM